MVLIVKLPNPNWKQPQEDSPPRPVPAPQQPVLDVLLAPRTLSHRYVRSHDRSLIVERPERIRAVLLGLSAVLGHVADGPTPSIGSSTTEGSLEDAFAKLEVKQDDHASAPFNPIQVLSSSRSLSLDPPDEAVAYVHAREGEEVEAHLPEYARRHRPQVSSAENAGGGDVVKREAGDEASAAPTLPLPHAAYLSRLCRGAPHSPPLPSFKLLAAEGEGDSSDDEHHSEVPYQLPQGDLYLRGPKQPRESGERWDLSKARDTQDSEDGGTADAIQHALGASALAVDRVMAAARRRASQPPAAAESLCGSEATPLSIAGDAASPPQALPALRSFVLTRPPGHHCSSNAASGFCWTNNAVVAAAHAHLRHGVRRVIILDCDLHHGNGTQSIAWRINADTVREQLEYAGRIAAQTPASGRRSGLKAPPPEPPEPPHTLSVFYGSVHDIESFPCEDGDPGLVRDASTCVAGAHGQWIWNVHLESHGPPNSFSGSYERTYSTLFARAREFLCRVPGDASQTLVIISAGFDACEHEHPGMQRHGKSVPPGFFARFARDSIDLAEEAADGKVISLLEGGYSDWALASGAMAHVAALSDLWTPEAAVDSEWWSVDALQHLDKMALRPSKAKAGTSGGAFTAGKNAPSWVQHSATAFTRLVAACGDWGAVPPPPPKLHRQAGVSASAPTTPLATGRTLRNRSSIRSPKAFDPAPPRSESKLTVPASKQPSLVAGVLGRTDEEAEGVAAPDGPVTPEPREDDPLGRAAAAPVTPTTVSPGQSADHSTVSTPTPNPSTQAEQGLASKLAGINLQDA